MSTARTLPLWQSLDSLSERHFQPAPARLDADVVIVGAGIAGLATALALLQQGRGVLVIDREGFGAGESLRTTAHLASALDDRFTHLQRWHGREGARMAAASHAAAIDWIEQLCAGGGCGFKRVSGYLFAHDGDVDRLLEEAQAARDAGLNARFLRDGLPRWPSLGPVLEFADQARVEMDSLMRLLARRAVELGARCVQANAIEVTGGERAIVELESGSRIEAAAAVVATNAPFHERVAVHTKQAPYRTYVVAAECDAGAIPDALIWDDGDPYHYVRWVARDEAGAGAESKSDPRGWAIVGGEDHKTGQDDDPTAYVRLQTWAREKFPALRDFTHAWSGQILEPVDGLAYIGADPGGERNVFVATGDSGNGVTHGVIAGLLLSELIQGRAHPWAGLYAPDRKTAKAGAQWLRENANVAAQYADWVSGGDISDPAALSPGQGGILRRGLRRLAMYRDGDGRLHSFSARCPHLGCAVRWSPQEKSWDCPCHGSRFEGATGTVLNGPATSALAPADIPAKDE